MMLVPLPFSGISLFIHLGIIGFVALASLFGFTRAKRSKNQKVNRHIATILVIVKPIVAIVLIGAIGGLTLLFMWIAILTGIRSGSDEPQRVFVENLFF